MDIYAAENGYEGIGMEVVDMYVFCCQNTVSQYISPWLILQLCLVEDRRSGEWLEDNDAERLVG